MSRVQPTPDRSYLEVPCQGVDERLFPDVGAAAAVVNMVHTRGGWRSAPGSERLIETDDRVRAVGWLPQHNGQGTLVIETGNSTDGGTLSAVRWAGPFPTLETIETGRRIMASPGYRTRFVAQGGWLYYFNGNDRYNRWNGRRVVPVGFDAPPPPISARSSQQGVLILDEAYGIGAGLAPIGPVTVTGDDPAAQQRGVGTRSEYITSTPQWVYGYSYTLVNDLGQESAPSPTVFLRGASKAMSLLETFGALYAVALEIPAPPPHAMAIRIRRTVNLYGVDLSGIEPPMYLLDEVEPTMSVMYFDDHPDAELGPQFDPDQVGATPSGVRLAAFFAGSHFVVAKNELWFTPPLRPEQFSDRLVVGGADGGEFRMLHATRGALVVARARGIYLVVPTETGSFRAVTLTEDTGALCSEAVEVPGVGVVFLSERGPCRLYGAQEEGTPTTYEFMGAGLEDTWRRVNVDALANATASLHRREREVWFHVPLGGEAAPSLGIVLHYPTGFFSTREDWDVGVFCETRDERADLFYGTSDGLWHVSRGYAQTRDVYWRSAPISISVEQTRVYAVVPLLLATGKHTLTVKTYLNRAFTASEEQIAYTLDPELGSPTYEGPPVWDDATWSASRRFDAVLPAKARIDLQMGAAGEFQVEFNGAGVSLPMFHLEVRNPGPAKPPPMGANR